MSLFYFFLLFSLKSNILGNYLKFLLITYLIVSKYLGEPLEGVRMRSKDLKLNLYRFLMFGLAIGVLVFPINAETTSNNQLAGSYQIDVSKSANISTVIENASRQNKLSVTDRIDLETKLNPASTLSIAANGKQVSLSSSASEPITLNADGTTTTAIAPNGTKVSIRSSLYNDTLSISSKYDGTNYSLTFKSINNGRSLQVIRSVKTKYLKQTVIGESYYNRANSGNISLGNSNNEITFSNNAVALSNDDFIVPNGTVLTVFPENLISTTHSQNNDKFRLKVQSPQEYEGAIIEGYLSGIKRTSRVSGTTKMTLNFEKIQMTNGKTHKFSGIIQSISDMKKTAINSSNEGQIKGKNKTNESIKRGILGATIGAVIGAAASGGDGAILGAAIGGGAGTGTMLLENNNLKLKKGWQITIQSTSPN